MDLNSLPVEMLELVLLHLDSSVCLVRASSACKLWRRVVADAAFLERARSLHETPVVGYYRNSDRFLTSRPSFQQAAPPTTTTVVAERYLSLDGLVPLERLRTWTVRDSRGCLLLLEKAVVKGTTRRRYLYVVEPLTRRYEKIAVAATPTSDRRENQAFLLDGVKPGRIGMSNFRVVCLSLDRSEAGIIAPGGSYRKVKTGNNQGKEMVCLGSAAGSMYWHTNGGTVFALEKATAEFSSFSLPDVVEDSTVSSSSKLAVTTGGDGEARIVLLAGDNKLKIFARLKARGDWVLERSMRRPELGSPSAHQNFYFGRSVPLSADTTGTVKMVASTGLTEEPAAFNLDIEKRQVKRTKYANAYPIRLPWPPSLHACTDA